MKEVNFVMLAGDCLKEKQVDQEQLEEEKRNGSKLVKVEVLIKMGGYSIWVEVVERWN